MTIEYNLSQTAEGQVLVAKDRYAPIEGLTGVELKQDRSAVLCFNNMFNYTKFFLAVQKFSSSFKVEEYQCSQHQNCQFPNCWKSKHAILIPTDSCIVPYNIFDWLTSEWGGNSKNQKAGYCYRKSSPLNEMFHIEEPEKGEPKEAVKKEQESPSETTSLSSTNSLPPPPHTAPDETSSASSSSLSDRLMGVFLSKKDDAQPQAQPINKGSPAEGDMRFQKPPFTPRHKIDESKANTNASSLGSEEGAPYLGSTYKKWTFEKEPFDILKIGQPRESLGKIREAHNEKWDRMHPS